MASNDLLSALPDIPRWVEVRGMLLSGRGRILHLDTHGSLSAVTLQDDVGLTVVLGCPPRDWILEGASRAGELLTVCEDADWIAAVLPAWQREQAIIFQLAPGATLPRLATESVRPLRVEELMQISGLPGGLRMELEVELEAGSVVVTSLADEQPVAFCYAGAVTEGWWDVAVDTLEPFRRRGHASRCVTAQIRRLSGAGRHPVWGAVRSNVPSQRLAEKLGFVPVDSIVVFRRPAMG